MHAIPSPYSNFSRSVTVSSFYRPYRHRTVSSKCPLMFLHFERNTITEQFLLTLRWSFYLMHSIQSPYSIFSLSVTVSTLCRPYRLVQYFVTLRFCFYLIHANPSPYINFSLSVIFSTLCTPYRPRTVTSHSPLRFLSYVLHTVHVK
jgi:hypothetical protein